MNPVWREVLQVALFNVAALCFAVGMFLLLAPQQFLQLTGKLNRWISTDAAFDTLDRPRSADRHLYRRHVLVGAFLALGSIYMLYMFWVWYDRARVMPGLPIIYSAPASAWIYDSLIIILRGAGVVGLVVGLVIGFRPSVLKNLESWGNRWIATDKWSKALDKQKDLPAEWFPGRPRLFGFGIVLGSFYIMLQCGKSLWGPG